MERCLINPMIFLALMVFSLICFLKDKLESSERPKCFFILYKRREKEKRDGK